MNTEETRKFYQISRTARREQRAQRVAEILEVELSGGSGAADLFDAMCNYIIGHRNGQDSHPARPALCPEAKGLRASGSQETDNGDE